jgi:hypothetical protein
MRNKLLILSAMALLLPVMPALACFPDADSDADEILFAPALRGRTATEDCQANGLNPGSYFDDKGRIVGSPCDPVEYCSDRDSTDIAVIDYCSDSWDEQQPDRDSKSKPRDPTDIDICKETPTFPTCYEDAFAPPTPISEPEPEEEPEEEDEQPEESEDKPAVEESE